MSELTGSLPQPNPAVHRPQISSHRPHQRARTPRADVLPDTDCDATPGLPAVASNDLIYHDPMVGAAGPGLPVDGPEDRL